MNLQIWQLIGSSGITIGNVEAYSPASAVWLWREKRGQTDRYYDSLYNAWTVSGSKIIFSG